MVLLEQLVAFLAAGLAFVAFIFVWAWYAERHETDHSIDTKTGSTEREHDDRIER